jgi:peptide/nickel transport system permease protein
MVTDMGLRSYIVRRLVYAVILIVCAMSLNFIIFQLMPGQVNTVYIQLKGLSQQDAKRLLAQFNSVWGLDEPLHVRYFVYLRNMFTWNFGTSMRQLSPVAGQIMYRIPWTLILIGLSTVISIAIGIVTGVISAYRRGTPLDSGILISSLILGSLPVFWLGLVFVVIFSIWLRIFPTSFALPPVWGLPTHPFPVAYTVSSSIIPGSSGIATNLAVNGSGALQLVGGLLTHAFLPVFTLSVFLFGGYTLLVRATMIDALTEDYIVTARAKGVSETSVLFRHALKNASLPIITAVALAFGFLFSGATITETVFSWPGLGRWIFDAVTLQDYFAMQAIFYIITLMVIISNIAADFLYGVVDPRIKYG